MRQRPDDDWSDRHRSNWYRYQHETVETCIRPLGACEPCMDAYGMKRGPS